MSAGHKNRKKGVKRSAETRAKISAANKGRKSSAETRAKISAAHKGMKGKRHNEETKAKISAAALKRKKKACPDCGKLFSKGNLTRHMDGPYCIKTKA